MRREKVTVVISGMNVRGRDFVDLLDVIGALRAADYDEAADQLVRLIGSPWGKKVQDAA